jgi:hypothetical protein
MNARRFETNPRESIISAMRIGAFPCSALLAACIAAQPAPPAPDSMGWITGSVEDSVHSEPIVGASVYLEGTNFGNPSDIQGTYLLGPCPAGDYVLTVAYTGYKTARKSTTVSVGCTTHVGVLRMGVAPVDVPPSDKLSPKEDSIKLAVDRLPHASLWHVRVNDKGKPEKNPNYWADNNRLLAKAWNVWLKGRGQFTIRSTQYGVEGGAIHDWLIIKDGTCERVVDREVDQFASASVRKDAVKELRLVYEPRYDMGGKIRHDLPPRAVLRLVYQDRPEVEAYYP